MDAFINTDDGKCLVTISEDEMSATITITSPGSGGKPVTLEDVKSSLAESGVSVNINEHAVEQASLLMLWDIPHLVATGTPPEEGKDGYIKYTFPMPDAILAPAESEDGSVDFRNLNLIHNVKQGDLLAELFPAIQGKDGWTVTGKVIHPQPVKTPFLVAGKDTVVELNGTRIVAAKDGHVSVVDGKPVVTSLYVVKHDVNFATGNIDFVGDVQVQGDVKSGFTIKAGGNVEVFGMVESADIHAGGNILIKIGIFGSGHSNLIAGGNILAKYVENASLKAGKDVIVNDSISRSQVLAGGKIKVSSPKGDIVGGHLEALDEISAAIFGSALAIPTLLELGIEPKFRAEYLSLLEKYKEKNKESKTLENFIIEYKNFREAKKEISESYKITIRDRLRKYSMLRNEMLSMELKLIEYETELARLSQGIVKATQMVYPGVIVSIVKTQFKVEEEMKRVMFVYDKGVVSAVPLRV